MRYKLADGSVAPTASLVANSRAIAGNPYAGPVDLGNPAVQAAIRAEAQRMVKSMSAVAPTPRSGIPPIAPSLPGRDAR